jgi:hypothetical protein
VSLVRPAYKVRDREGNTTIVALYFDNDVMFDHKNFVVGNTICVLYALRKTFMDGSQGIRCEDVTSVKGMKLGNALICFSCPVFVECIF